MVRILIFLFALFCSTISTASFKHTNLEFLSTKEGLGNNTICSTYQDKEGFMWFGTEIGISRYDGLIFFNYKCFLNSNNKQSIAPKAITNIQESSNKLLWAQTSKDGISCFDKCYERFLDIEPESQSIAQSINSFYLINDNTLYAASSKGLQVLNIELNDKKKGKKSIRIREASTPITNKPISQLYFNKKQQLLYGLLKDGKVLVYNPKLRTLSYIILPDSAKGTLQNPIINLFAINDYLWISRKYAGVSCYDLKTKQWQTFDSPQKDITVNLQKTNVYDIIYKNKSSYYLATSDGLYQVKAPKSTGSFVVDRLTEDEGYHTTMIEKRMTTVHYDKFTNQLWAGTFGSGILKFDLSEASYNQIQLNKGIQVNSIAEDANGHIWLSTNKSGLLKSVQNEVSNNTEFVPWTKSSGISRGYIIFKDPNGFFWISDDDATVLKINPITDEVKEFKIKLQEEPNFTGSIWRFFLDSRNRFWLATSRGLLLFDEDKGGLCTLYADSSGQSKAVIDIVEDTNGNLWAGTDNGVKKVEIKGNKANFIGGFEHEAGLEPSTVYSLHVNNYNQIYCSYIDQIIQIDARGQGKVAKTFILGDNLPCGRVYCVLDDKSGNLWLGSNSGIMTIRNNSYTFYNYLYVGNYNAACRLRDGRLIWANSWGLVYFDPEIAKKEPKDLLFISNIEVNNRIVTVNEERNGQIVLPQSPNEIDKLVLNNDNNNFKLYCTDLQYRYTQRKIAYRLLPEKKWQIVTLEDGISFNHIPPGEYTLQVQSIFTDASKGEIKELKIKVLPHWLRTWWAYTIYLFLALAIFRGMKSYKRKKKEQRREQENKEQELNEKLFNARLKRKQEQSLNEERNQLLTLVTHEMRTPLSLIITPLREMIDDSSLPEKFVSRMKLTYRNSVAMQDTCNQLLDIYTQDTPTDKLQITSCSISILTDHVINELKDVFKSSPIKFSYNKRKMQEIEIWGNRQKIEFVVRNMILNAFRHISYSGKISLEASTKEIEGKMYAIIAISDEGKGKVEKDSKDFLSTIVENKERIDFSKIELGYEVMKKVIEWHHGLILFTSEEGGGTEISCCIPLGKDHFKSDQSIEILDTNQELLINKETETTEDIKGKEEEEEIIEKEIPEDEEEEVVVEAIDSKKKLLVVDDNKEIRLYLKILLSPTYNIIYATNGQEGIDLALSELPDLILCDVMMPIKDGFECCREIKENLKTCHIPIVMLTAKVENEDIVKGIGLGADDYLLKPFNPDVLKIKIQNLIKVRADLKRAYTKLLIMPSDDNNRSNKEEEKIEKEEQPTESLLMKDLIRLIEDNIQAADFNVARLADLVHMSQPTLYRKVKQETDFTIIELIRGVRMKKAAILLKQRTYEVQEIAEMVGYNDIPTFRKHFVALFKQTPSAYAGSTTNSDKT